MGTRKVFISYNHRDKALARQLTSALRNADLDVWLDDDELRPGSDIALAIRNAIDDSDAAVFLVSPEWARSPVSSFEAAAAIARDNAGGPMTIVPIVTDREVRIPPFLADYRYLDASDRSLTAEDMSALVEALRESEQRPSRDAVRSARRDELDVVAATLHGAQAIERERALDRERTLRLTWAITLILSTALVALVAATEAVRDAALFLPLLTGVLGAAIGSALWRRSDR